MGLAKTLWTSIVDLVSTGQNVSDAFDVAFSNIDDAIDKIDANAVIIDNFSDSVGAETELTGILSIEDIVSLNTDIKKIDLLAFGYFIQGTKYNYAGATAISPTIGAGDSSTYVGVDSAGLVYSGTKFTTEQLKTILPLARLQAVQGQSGSGSDLQSPIHLTYSISQDGFTDREWIQNVVGALYADGGLYSENSITPLQVDQLEGAFHNAQRKHIDISSATNIEASAIYNVSSVPTLQARATLVIPKYYDNGTDIVALPTNKYVSHTLLRSPKSEDVFIFVYGDAIYDSQAQAEEANAEYSVFQNQAASGLMAVARFVVKGDSTNIEAIQDERPKFLLKDESTGIGTRPPSSACSYLSSAVETVIVTDGVFVKAAGTTIEVTTSADFTQTDNGRFQYTGTEKRRFKVEIVCSMTSVGNNQTVRGRLAINDTTMVASEQEQVGVGTRVGNMAIACMPELEENEYIEFWIANIGATSNLTVDYMNFNIISVD